MKAKILLFIIGVFFLSCNSQNSKVSKTETTTHKPHENVSVTKKYDENGNLMEFDSVYTSYYSNFDGDTLNTDSIMNQFSEFFNDNNNLQSMFFDNFYTPDSVLTPGFFHHNFFEDQFFKQDDEMLRMMRRMDSVKNTFFMMHSKSNVKK